jgi:hypothetical protein
MYQLYIDYLRKAQTYECMAYNVPSDTLAEYYANQAVEFYKQASYCKARLSLGA